MTSLDDLGFHKGSIGETVVSTYDADGQPNAAPMGVVIESDERLLIRPYILSLTYRNLQAKRCAVVNVTSNPETFYLTAFKEANPDGKLSPELFKKAEDIPFPRAASTWSFIREISGLITTAVPFIILAGS